MDNLEGIAVKNIPPGGEEGKRVVTTLARLLREAGATHRVLEIEWLAGADIRTFDVRDGQGISTLDEGKRVVFRTKVTLNIKWDDFLAQVSKNLPGIHIDYSYHTYFDEKN